MLTPEQILEIARAHCFYPDADLTALVRAIEKTAETAAIERCAKVCESTYAKDAFHFELGTACAAAIRALRLTNTGGKE